MPTDQPADRAAVHRLLLGEPVGSSNESFFIRNTEGFQYLAPNGSRHRDGGSAKQRTRALMLVLNSSLRAGFGLSRLSYVLSKAEGNVDNSGFGTLAGGTAWDSPNTAIINADGELTNSTPARDQGLRVLPGAEDRRDARWRLHRLERPAVHAVPAVQQRQLNLPLAVAAADLPGAARHREERLLQQGRSAGGEGVPRSRDTGSVSTSTSSTCSTRDRHDAAGACARTRRSPATR